MKKPAIEQVFILNVHASISTLNDAFHNQFARLAALMQIALNDNFSENSKEIIYHYLSIGYELVKNLRTLYEILNQNDKQVS